MKTNYRVRLGAVCLLIGMTVPAINGSVLYGGLGGHNNGDSTNDGALAFVNQTTGAVSVIGPTGVPRISGLAFDSTGALFAASQTAGGFPPPPAPVSPSLLLRLNPITGAQLYSVPITDGGVPISIADLAVQPGTGALFGIRGPADQLNGQGQLYTINKTTGVATLLGNTGDFFASIAFAPNGTLYMTSADLGMMGQDVNIALKTINPTNAATLTTVPLNHFFGALGIRPEDGAIFGGTGDHAELFTINPTTGAETLIGSTGRNFVGDLAFAPIPEPASFALIAFGGLGLVLLRKRVR